jgi:hypothetical protein
VLGLRILIFVGSYVLRSWISSWLAKDRFNTWWIQCVTLLDLFKDTT